MTWLLAALIAPAVGPVLYRVLHPRPEAVRLVDGFVYLAVPALVAWQVLPHAWEERNPALVVALVAGFLLPAAVERASQVLADKTDNMALIVGLSGLVLHAGLEGTALVPGPRGVDPAFDLAVILHRIPVGLVLWWLIRPRFGVRAAAMGVGSLILATLVGYAVGSELIGETHYVGFELYQAFVSGSLVHVVYHQGRHDHDHGDGYGHRHHHHDHRHEDHHHDP